MKTLLHFVLNIAKFTVKKMRVWTKLIIFFYKCTKVHLVYCIGSKGHFTVSNLSDTSHQSPVNSYQSTITSHQSPVTSHQSPATSILDTPHCNVQKLRSFREKFFFTQIVTKHGFVLTPSFLYYMMKCSTEAEKIEYVKMS